MGSLYGGAESAKERWMARNPLGISLQKVKLRKEQASQDLREDGILARGSNGWATDKEQGLKYDWR
jgi:hypothetical protein